MAIDDDSRLFKNEKGTTDDEKAFNIVHSIRL